MSTGNILHTGKTLRWSFTVATVLTLLFANRSHALVTSYLIEASNQLAAVRATLTNDTPAERRAATAIGRALNDLSKPSTNLTTDYNLFVAAALHLGALINDPGFSLTASNVFHGFTNDMAALIGATANRIAALNDFVRTKRPASNVLASAVATLNRLSGLTPKAQILIGRQILAKLALANRLALDGELHPGFALNSVTGHNLTYNVARGPNGNIYFNNTTQYTQTESITNIEIGTYTYTRNALNSADLVMNGPDNTNTIQLRYRSATNGTFSGRSRHDGRTESVRGTFTID